MIILRETFIAKPGQASKLANLFKEVSVIIQGEKYRVLTDLVSDFNQVILETEYDSLEAFEKRMAEYQTSDELKEKMKGYTDMYQGGKREIFKVV